MDQLDPEDDFFRYQKLVNSPVSGVASHVVIQDAIEANGRDYRFETEEHPIPALRNRTKDNTTLGRKA